MPKVRINSKGQLTLPKECWDILDVKHGDTLDVEVVDGSRLTLKVDRNKCARPKMTGEGIVKLTAGLLNEDELNSRYIDELRKSSSQRLREAYERGR